MTDQFQNGESALHAAALFGNLPVIKQLIAAGCDPSIKNQDNLTALQIARQQKNYAVVEYLKEREGYSLSHRRSSSKAH
jgi:ankyrin repeat protein